MSRLVEGNNRKRKQIKKESLFKELQRKKVTKTKKRSLIKESLFKESTSNFKSVPGFPLLAFDMETEVIDELSKEAVDFYIDDSEDEDATINRYVKDHINDYSSYALLADYEVEELEDDLKEFTYDLNREGTKLLDNDELDTSESHRTGRAIRDIDIVIRPGYYEGWQILVLNYTDDAFQYKQKIVDFLKGLKKKYRLTELQQKGLFDNGESVYSIKEQKQRIKKYRRK